MILKNKLSHTSYNYSRGMIFLNFSDPATGKRGCRFHCDFCCWNGNNFIKRLVPTNEEVTEFITEYFPQRIYELEKPLDIHITGGGDPLYNYEENKIELLRIIKCIKDLGCTISIVTKEWETVAKYWQTDLLDVHAFVFSCETMIPGLQDLCKQILAAGKHARVTKIFNFSTDMNEVNWDSIKKFIKFYKDIPVYLRENFNCSISEETFLQQREKLYKLKNSGNIYGKAFFLSRDTKCHIGLYQNEVWNTYDYDNIVRQNQLELLTKK